MSMRRILIIHSVLPSIINQCNGRMLLRMLVGIWFTHNYFYHKPRWRLRLAGGWGWRGATWNAQKSVLPGAG